VRVSAPGGPQQVRGPSALGGGALRFWELLWLMSVTEFKRVYFGTVLGYLWSLVRPLLLFGALLFVFTKVFRVGSEKVEHYPVMLLIGIVLYGFFQESTSNALGSVLAQEAVVRKTQFPRLVIPLASVLTALFNLALNLIVVFVFVLAFGVDPAPAWLLFPLAVAALFALAAGVGTALSVLQVRFRDVAIIWAVTAQVLLYMTPILYPVDAFADRTYERLLMVNPLAVILSEVRIWILQEPGAPTPLESAGGWLGLVPAASIFIAILLFAAWIFRREAPRIAEAL